MNEKGLNVKLVVFKRIVDGDLSKFTATSNTAQTGGGARDLRFSPVEIFMPVFERMFKEKKEKYIKGTLIWSNGEEKEVDIYLPTKSRPKEIRISKVNECFPVNELPPKSEDCVLLLVLEETGKVRLYFTTLESLKNERWHHRIKAPIIAALEAKGNKNAMGFIDVENDKDYPKWN